MRVLYSYLLVLSTPFVLIYFLLRGLKDRSYLRRWPERFGYLPHTPQAGGLLIHAASVGEFNAASSMIRALLKKYPDLPITVTTQTPTGSARVKDELGDRVLHGFIPFDLPWIAATFLGRLQPAAVIVMETEIWPNLYLEAQRMNIPLLMANARLSAKSVARYAYLEKLVSRVLQSVHWIGAQSAADAERLTACGADPAHVEVTGNLKFDMDVAASLTEKAEALRTRWNRNRPVLVAGSTHEADENVVLPAFAGLLETLPDALLILVPRYPERFERAAQLAVSAGLSTQLRSQTDACDAVTQCFVIDAIGELMTWYACADAAFVGGSIGDQGGHNALEPAALGKPVLFGPNMVNAREIADQLLACSAAREVSNPQDFKATALQILTDGVLRDRMGQAGLRLIQDNRGALDSTLAAIDKVINQRKPPPMSSRKSAALSGTS
jgi:3-deoxy-D-manno-octulosonic-acid transferase